VLVVTLVLGDTLDTTRLDTVVERLVHDAEQRVPRLELVLSHEAIARGRVGRGGSHLLRMYELSLSPKRTHSLDIDALRVDIAVLEVLLPVVVHGGRGARILLKGCGEERGLDLGTDDPLYRQAPCACLRNK
jgi:hypothetical protein